MKSEELSKISEVIEHRKNAREADGQARLNMIEVGHRQLDLHGESVARSGSTEMSDGGERRGLRRESTLP